MTAVITNIDQDHMATYEHDFEKLKSSFVEFAHRLPFYGSVILCVDDLEARNLIPSLSRPVVTYGCSEDAQFRATNIKADGQNWSFTVEREGWGDHLDVSLSVPGQHNVMNALAAIAVASEEGIEDRAILEGLDGFAGVDRRFQVTGDIVIDQNQMTLVDDYGHHPTEVDAVIKTARRVWPEQKIAMVYQPHRFSRTRDLFDDFVRVLSEVDSLILLEVYSAGETPISGAGSKDLAQAIRQRGQVNPVYAKDPDEALQLLPSQVRNGEILLVQGAGNVSIISTKLRDKFD
jgi:UDP-N-acetylmuramate--alanine ligase